MRSIRRYYCVYNDFVVDNGQKAVDREAAEPFGVVLMDMQMPCMDGVAACKIIMTRQGGHPKAAVAFVTAHASVEIDMCARVDVRCLD
jgi:CheY-like chemotaxis protein